MTSPYIPSPLQTTVETGFRAFLIQILPSGIEIIEGQDNRVPEPVGPDFVVFTEMSKSRLATNDDEYADCAFIGSICGVVLNVTQILLGTILIGNVLFGANIIDGTTIVSQLSGDLGGVGTYALSINYPGDLINVLLASGEKLLLQSAQVTFQVDVHGPNSSNNAVTITTCFRDDIATHFFFTNGFRQVSPLYADDAKQIPYWNDQQQIEDRWVINAEFQVDYTLTAPQQFMAAVHVGLINVVNEYAA